MNPIRFFAVLLCGMTLTLHSPATPADGQKGKDVTAAQVNGTWKCRLNILRHLGQTATWQATSHV